MSWEGVISAPPYTSFLCHVAVWILSRDWVTTDGVLIVNRIYWTLTERNYKQLRQYHWVTHSEGVYMKSSQFSLAVAC
jgi:hypothetical protein